MKRQHFGHFGQSGTHVIGLMGRKEQFKQGCARIDYCEQGEIVAGFQKKTKKTHIARCDADQENGGSVGGRMRNRFAAAGAGAARRDQYSGHYYFIRYVMRPRVRS